jgi:hypothetical protein
MGLAPRLNGFPAMLAAFTLQGASVQRGKYIVKKKVISKMGKNNWRSYFVNGCILIVTLALSCLGFEVAIRFILDPADFLQVTLVPDADLKFKILPYSGGHDAWGLRNSGGVPQHADILAIGDSFTYGMAAPSNESWPAWLARLSGHSVYNMGLGGYGPVEYTKMLLTKGIQLKPRIVIIGLYLGNDIYDSYTSASHQTDPEIEKHFEHSTAVERGRDWLSRNSMIYGISKLSFPRLVSFFRFRAGVKEFGASAIVVKLAGQEVILIPRFIYRLVDVSDDRIAHGLARTKEEIQEIAQTCATNAFKCYFLIIPTKEYVAWPLVEQSLSKDERKTFEVLVEAESNIDYQIKEEISKLGLPIIDPLDNLRAAWMQNAIYPPADGHLNGAGYEVIARKVWNTLTPP